MRSNQQLEALAAEAMWWEGTPFADRGGMRGVGVTCHNLPLEILMGAGWIPRFPIPDGPTGWAASHGDSLMEAWMENEGAQWFDSIPPVVRAPGDLLGFRLGRCVHHLALVIPQGIIHAIAVHGAIIAPEIPGPWVRRLARAWRPKKT